MGRLAECSSAFLFSLLCLRIYSVENADEKETQCFASALSAWISCSRPRHMTKSFESCPELPASPGRIVLFSVTALVLGIGLACWIETPRGPVCHGVLMARTTTITAKSKGILHKLAADEGASVGINDPLVEIMDESLDRRILSKSQEIASLQSELQRTLAATELEMTWRLRTLESEICDIQLRSASFLKEKYNFELQQSMLNDVLAGDEFAMANAPESLFKSVVIDEHMPPGSRMATVFEMEMAANAAEVSAAQVEICDVRQKQLEQLRESLPQQIRRTQGVDVAEANLAQAQAELDRLQHQQRELVIASPSIGRVGVFHHQLGDQIVPGDRIVELLDDSQRYLVVSVPSHDITEFSIGTTVELEFPGSQVRTGNVTNVAPQAQPSQSFNVLKDDATVLIHVEPTGRLWPSVPIGSRVMVRVSQKHAAK